MNDKEKKLWQWIRRGNLPGTWERLEALLPLGLPDCLVHWNRTFLVELKVVENWSESDFGLRPEQAEFIDRWNRVGGEAYVLVRIAGELFWFKDVIAIRRRMTSPALAVPGPFA